MLGRKIFAGLVCLPSRHELGALACLVIVASLGVASVRADETKYKRTEDVIYGRKLGVALTMDVFQPENPNGAAVIFCVSGGWHSQREMINLGFMQTLLDRGYTVFAVMHGSEPRFTIPEALEDMNRATRYIRNHAADYKIDPQRIGISGGSAGGHSSLMQGTAGSEGKADAKDPVERESSRVQAVACFFPPTDFLNYGKPGENAIGRGVLKNFKAPFDFVELQTGPNHMALITDEKRIEEIGRQISPVTHVTSDDPPTLIIHGDKDLLVPIQQAEIFVEKLKGVGVPAELSVKAGAAHGWPDIGNDMSKIADWFDKYLAEKPKQ